MAAILPNIWTSSSFSSTLSLAIPNTSSSNSRRRRMRRECCGSPLIHCAQNSSFSACGGWQSPAFSSVLNPPKPPHGFSVMACLPPVSSSPKITSNSSARLYVSGLSFRTTEESLRNAFQNFGQLVEVNLVIDKIAKRPRGFAFLSYATEEEAKKAIEGMHGKFLDGRVIFVEVAKPRSELHKGPKQNPRQY